LAKKISRGATAQLVKVFSHEIEMRPSFFFQGNLNPSCNFFLCLFLIFVLVSHFWWQKDLQIFYSGFNAASTWSFTGIVVEQDACSRLLKRLEVSFGSNSHQLH
jgi:hypothetical protein